MFQLKHHTRKGHKTKLFAAVAYALAGLLASGSAYAVTVEEVDAKAEKNKAALTNLTQTLAEKEQALTEAFTTKLNEEKAILLQKEKALRTEIDTKEAEAREFVKETKDALATLVPLAPQVETNKTDIAANKAAIDTKADKTALDAKADQAALANLAQTLAEKEQALTEAFTTKLNEEKAILLEKEKALRTEIDTKEAEAREFVKETKDALATLVPLAPQVETNKTGIAANKAAIDTKADKTALEKAI